MRTLAFFGIVAALFSACSSSNTVDRPDGSQGEPCGAVTCDVDQVCCNASCGICAPPGVSCTTVECEPPDECAPMDASPVELCEVLLGYVGRLAPEKELHRLTELAQLPGTRLVLVAILLACLLRSGLAHRGLPWRRTGRPACALTIRNWESHGRCRSPGYLRRICCGLS